MMMDHSERQVKHLKHIKHSRIFPLNKETLHTFSHKKIGRHASGRPSWHLGNIEEKTFRLGQKPIGVLSTIGSTMPKDINNKETASPKAFIVVM